MCTPQPPPPPPKKNQTELKTTRENRGALKSPYTPLQSVYVLFQLMDS